MPDDWKLDPRLAGMVASTLRALDMDEVNPIVHAAQRLAHEAYQLGRHDALLELRTTEQAAAELGIDRTRVHRIATERSLGWLVSPRTRVFTAADIDAMRERTPGRPRKT